MELSFFLPLSTLIWELAQECPGLGSAHWQHLAGQQRNLKNTLQTSSTPKVTLKAPALYRIRSLWVTSPDLFFIWQRVGLDPAFLCSHFSLHPQDTSQIVPIVFLFKFFFFLGKPLFKDIPIPTSQSPLSQATDKSTRKGKLFFFFLDDAFSFLFLKLFIYYSFWLCRVLVAAHGNLRCGMQDLLVAACMWDLVPQPGNEPGLPALWARSLTHWTTREVPKSKLLNISLTQVPRTPFPLTIYSEALRNKWKVICHWSSIKGDGIVVRWSGPWLLFFPWYISLASIMMAFFSETSHDCPRIEERVYFEHETWPSFFFFFFLIWDS